MTQAELKQRIAFIKDRAEKESSTFFESDMHNLLRDFAEAITPAHTTYKPVTESVKDIKQGYEKAIHEMEEATNTLLGEDK